MPRPESERRLREWERDALDQKRGRARNIDDVIARIDALELWLANAARLRSALCAAKEKLELYRAQGENIDDAEYMNLMHQIDAALK